MMSLQTTRHPSSAEAPLDKNRGVNSLPDELLSEIFRLVQNDELARSWYRVLWVCHRWSTVGRSAAMLWSNITIERQPKDSFVAASLEYSKNTYLTIHLEHAVKFGQTLSLLSPHIHRIRVLKLFGTWDTKGRHLATFLNHNFPSLEIFVQNVPPEYGSLAWRPDAAGFPRLRHLHLEGYVSIEVAPTAAVFPALQKLVLGPQDKPSFTLPSFVQFLSRHIHVEELRLRQYRPKSRGLRAALTFPSTIRSFILEDDTIYVNIFLSAFTHIPAHVRLCVTRDCDDWSWTEFERNTSLFVSRMLPKDPLQHLPVLSRVCSLKIDSGADRYYNLAGYVHPSDTIPSIQLNSSLPDDFGWDVPFHWRLANVTRALAGAPITEVRFVGHRELYPAPPRAEWAALLDKFPLLEHVAIEETMFGKGLDARMGLLEALLAPDPVDGTRWPRLRRLTLICGDWENCDEDSLVNLQLTHALRHRAQQDAKVDELRLLLVHEDQNAGIEEKDRLISEFVERAAWKDIVNNVSVDFVQYPSDEPDDEDL